MVGSLHGVNGSQEPLEPFAGNHGVLDFPAIGMENRRDSAEMIRLLSLKNHIKRLLNDRLEIDPNHDVMF